MTVPSDLKTEALALSPSGAFVWLVSIQVNPSQTVPVTNHDSDLTFDGVVYQAFPVSIGNRSEAADGNQSTMSIRLGNELSDWDTLAKENCELTDCEVTLYFGSTLYIADPTKWISYRAIVTDSSRDTRNVTLSIQPRATFDQRVPCQRLLRNQCGHSYRDAGCQYSSQVATVVDATNTSPIIITTDDPHGFKDGASVLHASIGGNTAANGTHVLTVLSATTYSIPVAGSGAYTSGGTATVSLPSCDNTFTGANGCIAHDNTINFQGNPSVVAVP